MNKMATVLATMILLQCSAVFAAAATDSKDSAASPAPNTAETATADTVTKTAEKTFSGYPPYTKKRLYAEHDLRGQSAPKLTVSEWLNGAAPDTKGKVVLLDFWATWCGPCGELVPELNQYKKKFGNDLVIIGITDETAKEVKKFRKATPIDYDIALAPGEEMYNAVGINGIPHCLVISADGIVRWQGFPPMDEDPLTEEKLAQIIQESKKQEAKTASP
ncbi:MAG: TlpA family protein disulfide reductase [Candidatus Melainabacteria bacterium]|nr:TlpA family protein disulfide reductase [Candidatus Melainabacteria bacterium]